jgi:hypothetical protein
VPARNIALIESFAARGERTFYGTATFRANLVRFVRLMRTYLHRVTPHFRSAHQPTRSFHSSSMAFTNPAHASSRGFYLFSLTICIIFFERHGHDRRYRLRKKSMAREILALSGCGSWPKKPQVPPLRFAPVGMTIPFLGARYFSAVALASQ